MGETLLPAIDAVGLLHDEEASVVASPLSRSSGPQLRVPAATDGHRDFEHLFEEAPIVIFAVEGIEHRLSFANRACLAALGKHDLLGQPLRTALPDRAQRLGRVLDDVLRTGEASTEYEIELGPEERTDHGSLYVNCACQPKRDRHGKTAGVLVWAFDVTEQVLARRRDAAAVEALRLRDEQLGLAVRSAGLIVFGQDKDLRHLWIHNPVAGVTRESIIGKTDAELHAPENAVRLETLKRRVLMGECVREEVALRWPAETRYYHLTLEPHRDSTGEIDGLLGASLDVTEQVRAREHLESLTAQVRESEAQFRTLADSIPQLAWIAEPNGEIRWYNQRWYDYTGTSQEQISSAAWSAVHDPGELPRVEAGFKAALASGQPWEDTFPLRRADGVYQWFLSRAMSVRDSAGRIVRWFGTNTNVDEHRKYAAALSAAVQLREDFLSIAGHELRTPLSALMMHVESIQRARALGVETEAKLDERLAKAAKAGERLDSLINQMLDVSRITAGQLQLDRESFFLDDLLRDVIERFSEQAEGAGSPIELRASPRVDGVWDHLRIEQVFTNLIGNALKYGRGKPIAVELAVHELSVDVRVIDGGIGIHPSLQDKIFDRFERAVASREFGGLGLGLWICRQIVEASGGTIAVESAPLQGSTFTVSLPRDAPNGHG